MSAGGAGKKVADVAAKAVASAKGGKGTIDWDGMYKLVVSDEARKEFANLRRVSFDEVNTTLQTKFSQVKDGVSSTVRTPFLTFVLGGPGSGKGTQCEKIVESFGFTHLSAGDLLRQAIASNYKDSAMIFDTIKEGKIVPSEVTVKLIQRAIESSNNYKFLVDGFPRSEENRIAFEKIIGAEPDVVLFFDVPEEEMVKRVLSRNQGRIDDNIDTMKKRLEVFAALNLPVIKHYSELGKVQKISAVGTADEVFDRVCAVFAAYEVRWYSEPQLSV